MGLLLPWMQVVLHIAKARLLRASSASGGRSGCHAANQSAQEASQVLEQLRARELVVLLSAAIGSYVFCWVAQAVIGTFQCRGFASILATGLPGEVNLPGVFWVGDMNLHCWQGQHLVLVVCALLIGMPLLSAYLALLLVMVAFACVNDSGNHTAARQPEFGHVNSSATGGNNHVHQQGMSQHAVSTASKHALPASLVLFLKSRLSCCTWEMLQPALSCLSPWALPASWWWPVSREMLKMLIVLVSTSSDLRDAEAQVLSISAIVAIAGLLQFLSVPGKSLRMERHLLVSNCLLQALCGVVMMLAVLEASPVAVASALLAFVGTVAVSAAARVGLLAVQALSAARALVQWLALPAGSVDHGQNDYFDDDAAAAAAANDDDARV
jgi:hypothetical protein